MKKITKGKIIKAVSLVLGFVGISIYHYYRCKDSKGEEFEFFAQTWLEMSLIFCLIATAVSFIMLFEAINGNSNKSLGANLSESELKRIRIGIRLGFYILLGLLVFIIIQILDVNQIPRFSSTILLYISIGLAISAYLVDWLLGVDKNIRTFNFFIIISLVITCLLSHFYKELTVIKASYILGFTSGSTALQVILAGLYFNPDTYTKEKIFKES